MQIIRATNTDAIDLTELTIRSKAHWGYDKKLVEAWRDELTITQKYVQENQIYKLQLYN